MNEVHLPPPPQPQPSRKVGLLSISLESQGIVCTVVHMYKSMAQLLVCSTENLKSVWHKLPVQIWCKKNFNILFWPNLVKKREHVMEFNKKST